VRVKTGPVTQRRHKKILQLTKGQRGSKHLLFKRGNEAMMKSLVYAYRDRRNRKREFRRLWIARINAATRQSGMSYSVFMHGLKVAGIDIDRKMLADIAVNDAATFGQLVETAKAATA
jgi:large subunit ribosomal protein L20